MEQEPLKSPPSPTALKVKPKSIQRLHARLASLEAEVRAGEPVPDELAPFAAVLMDADASDDEKRLAALRAHAFGSLGGASDALLWAIERAEAQIRPAAPEAGSPGPQPPPLAVRDDQAVQATPRLRTLPSFMAELRRQRLAGGW